MNCTQSHDLLGAWIDGQLPPAAQAEVQDHVRDCKECRMEAESLRDLHADLRRAFLGPRAAAVRVAEQVVASLSKVTTPAHRERAVRRRIRRSSALAMACGFLLAVLVFRPWKTPTVVTEHGRPPRDVSDDLPAAPAVARLVIATDPEGIEFDGGTRGAWRTVAAMESFRCPSEGAVRTHEDARCELVTTDGCVVRMNGGAEIVFHSAGRIELKRGEIWCRSTPQTPLEVHPSLPREVVDHSASGAAPLFSCTAADATCVMSVAEGNEKALVTAAVGNISVKARDASIELQPSESATITGGHIDRNRSADRVLAVSWMQPLLIRKGHDDRELADRVDDLLAQIGETKLSALYEAEIRALGEYGVLPLLRYVESPRSRSDGARRRAAMRIVSDLAPSWAIGDLIGLLQHSDPDVRAESARALQRLTQLDQGASPETWRADTGEWAPAAAAWQAWWTGNRGRYPTWRDGSKPGSSLAL